ncbi:MAG: A/G-specific adenine glycosylase [Verrucomicrobiota bacterium]|nr:A/G-specific adenine glycosylase [Verrucomicrobiota bacterium]
MPRKAKAPASPLLTGARARQRFRTKLHAWFQQCGRDLPWRRTRDPYAIMVSEFMLQQTQVATVIPYFERWLARFPAFTALAAAREDEVLALWQGLGYYSRARNLHRAAQQVVAEHGGALPADPALIARLPGVGPYTAGAIASFAFDLPVATVDGNIARVLARLLNLREPIDSSPALELLWRAAELLLPPHGGGLHTSSLMELGALLCTPGTPRCLLCPVREFCAADDPESLPLKKPRRKTLELREECAWVIDRDRILLERQTGSRWRGLWKLPLLDTRPAGAESLVQLAYPFTHHRVILTVFAGPVPATIGPAQEWFSRAELEAIAIPAPHRRALLSLLNPSAPHFERASRVLEF